MFGFIRLKGSRTQFQQEAIGVVVLKENWN